jgi:hypothetical protein
MRKLICQNEITSIPLVEVGVYLENEMLIVEFSLIDDTDICFKFSKKYDNSEMAAGDAAIFCEGIKQNSGLHWEGDSSFAEQKEESRIKLIECVLNKSLDLPSGGLGFSYDGDNNYLHEILSSLKGKNC